MVVKHENVKWVDVSSLAFTLPYPLTSALPSFSHSSILPLSTPTPTTLHNTTLHTTTS